MPGLYELTENDETREVALLVPAVESNTQALALDTWEQLGVPLSADDRNEQTRAAESSTLPAQSAAALESRQQMWRWLLWVAVALLAIESAASFIVSKRRGAAATSAA